jgi:hypothetical protein
LQSKNQEKPGKRIENLRKILIECKYTNNTKWFLFVKTAHNFIESKKADFCTRTVHSSDHSKK